MRNVTAALMLSALLLSGCGEADKDDQADAGAPTAKPTPSADPKGDWISAVVGLCTDLSGAVSGQILTAGNDGKITPSEVLAGEKAARPAVVAFDKGLAALPAPPEAAGAEKALKDLMALNKPTVAELLAAAQADDQAKLNAVFAEREGIRLGPQGIASLTAVGLPEKCNYRMSFS
jgi:hypothetical protein